MIKTVKVEELIKYARNCTEFAKINSLPNNTKREYTIRAETIRAYLAEEDANRKYKPETGKDKEWSKYFKEVWEEYDNMIFR